MAELPIELIQEFAQTMRVSESSPTEMTVYGQAVVDGSGGVAVRFDGSTELTPVDVAAPVKNADRVIVRLRGRQATIIGNLTDPSGAGVTSYTALQDKPKIEGVELIGNKTFEELNLESITNSEIEFMLT